MQALNLDPAHRLGVVHVVEGGDLVDADIGHAEIVGDVVHDIGRQPAAGLLLGESEQRQDGALLTAFRVARDDLLGFRLILFGKR